jgi:rubrerythrin
VDNIILREAHLLAVDFLKSETKLNLMKAFAGESQARNRYTFAASVAKKQNLHVVEAIFSFTAGQEKEHAEVFYSLLKEAAGEKIKIDGDYPVDITESIVQLLRYAQQNEYEEHDPVYKSFGDKAQEEGFPRVASVFHNIAEIEKTHGNRFGQLADLLEQSKLFVSDMECDWMCLNCGYIYNGTQAPEKCPVCSHDKGFFIRLELAPYTGKS